MTEEQIEQLKKLREETRVGGNGDNNEGDEEGVNTGGVGDVRIDKG